MAECHPVGFQWVTQAQRRGATVVHVDPRFTRTSAVADVHVPLRAGSDIAFLGGIVNHILENEADFREYVLAYTNAATIISSDYRDTEDLDGLFSGWDPETQRYEDISSWQYEGMPVASAAGLRSRPLVTPQAQGAGGAPLAQPDPPRTDPTLQDPQCVYQILKRHFRRYTPEYVAAVTGVSEAQFAQVARLLVANSGRERTAAFCYAVGWTQHTVGVQYIRTAAIIQLLLGNIGRPGGGIMALRGHASIQGSTDIPTLFDLLPGYLPMPSAQPDPSLAAYLAATGATTGSWGDQKAYLVSLLKAWWGDAATPQNEFCFDYLPRISGDHSTYATTMDMRAGKVAGLMLFGQNPAVGSANGKLQRLAMAELEWLVVRDLFEIESATFWKDSPEIASGELETAAIKTEVFLLPAASHVEKAGSFTQTQRLLQWRHQAVEPQDDQRSELWFAFHLGRRIRAKLAESNDPRDRPLRDLTWNYPVQGSHDDPDPEAVLREINGWDAQGRLVSGFHELKADGSTACGCWIYSGCYAEGVNQTARRTPWGQQDATALDWGWAWPANRRMLYNRASADPQGRPWSERKAYVWWDEAQNRWTGLDVPDFPVTKRPDYVPAAGATGAAALSGSEPFIMQADGRGWLFAPAGIVDGPLPVHYEPDESPFGNQLHPAQRANPMRRHYDDLQNPSHLPPEESWDPRADPYPYVMTTYRLTEHHTAGGMSRTVGRLAALQPEMFCEVSPDLAAERGLVHGDWATVITARTAIEARVMVTERMTSLTVQGQRVHQVGLPYHWGGNGLVTGDSANDLFAVVVDPNVHIQEVKAATCDIVAGRRPTGAALTQLVAQWPRAHASLRTGGEPESL